MRTSELHLILNSKQKGFRNAMLSVTIKFLLRRKSCVWSYSSRFLVTIWTKMNQKSPKTLFTVSKFAGQRLYLHFSIISRPWVSVRPRESKPFYSQALNWLSLPAAGESSTSLPSVPDAKLHARKAKFRDVKVTLPPTFLTAPSHLPASSPSLSPYVFFAGDLICFISIGNVFAKNPLIMKLF